MKTRMEKRKKKRRRKGRGKVGIRSLRDDAKTSVSGYNFHSMILPCRQGICTSVGKEKPIVAPGGGGAARPVCRMDCLPHWTKKPFSVDGATVDQAMSCRRPLQSRRAMFIANGRYCRVYAAHGDSKAWRSLRIDLAASAGKKI